MAVVYAGWHEQLERPVALKVLAEHLAGDPDFRARFLREARIASKLHHPNLVQTYDITEIDGVPCIVMELVTGGTLEGEALTREEAGEVAAGVAHAHSRGVVHRDLKPANLLRATSGEVKIADFGIARALEETMVTQIGTVLGTMRYLSPEQAEGRVVGTEADVYSLGVVLDELLEAATDCDRALIEPHARPRSRRAPDAPPRSRRRSASRRPLPRPTRVQHRPRALATRSAAARRRRRGGDRRRDRPRDDRRHDSPPRVEPVPHATTPAQQARNLSAWLKTLLALELRALARRRQRAERDALAGERELDVFARLEDPPLDRGERDLERVGDLVVGETDDVAEQQRHLQVDGQAVDRAPERVDRLDPLDRLVEHLELRCVVEVDRSSAAGAPWRAARRARGSSSPGRATS